MSEQFYQDFLLVGWAVLGQVCSNLARTSSNLGVAAPHSAKQRLAHLPSRCLVWGVFQHRLMTAWIPSSPGATAQKTKRAAAAR